MLSIARVEVQELNSNHAGIELLKLQAMAITWISTAIDTNQDASRADTAYHTHTFTCNCPAQSGIK